MRRHSNLAVPCLLVTGLAAIPASAVLASPRPAIGDAVSLPSLAAIDGTRLDAAALAGRAALVLGWTDLECPMAKLYLPRLAALEAEYAERDVLFLVVDSTAADEPAALTARARELGLRAALVRDEGGALARRLGVRRTTEVLVLDRHGRLAYRGALDDQYGYRRHAGQGAATFRRDRPSRHYMRDALAAVLEGKVADPQETDPLGCELTLENHSAAPVPGHALAPIPTFHETIEPILQRSCQECHRRDAGAPFSLETYDDARRRARMLREVVRERRMPPWNADRRAGKFRNDPSLGEEEILAISRWADAGAPEGDPDKAPPPRRFAEGWDIGEPDVVFETPPFEVPASGVVPYRYVRIRNVAVEDRWVEAAQVRSTGRGLVHHVLVFLENVPQAPSGAERPWRPDFNPLALLEGAKPEDVPRWIRRFRQYIRKDLGVGGGGGLNGYFVSSNAGQQPTPLPPGCARLLPAGATLVFQIHYTPTGEAFTSTTRLGLRFAEGPSPRALDCRAIATVAFAIPPGAASHEVQASYVLPRAATLHSLRPHMHRRGKSFRYVAEHPGGSSDVLLSVPAWDFDWQVDYQLAVPLRLERGTRLRAIAVYDNSRENPYNPDPAQTVYFGLQSDEEMMIGYFEAVWDDEEPSPENQGSR